MTVQEVESILGPEGNYCTGVIEWAGWVPDHLWISDDALIWVDFDNRGQLVSKHFQVPDVVREPLWHRICRWLGID